MVQILSLYGSKIFHGSPLSRVATGALVKHLPHIISSSTHKLFHTKLQQVIWVLPHLSNEETEFREVKQPI